MTTQYTPSLKLALPVTGELSGTWGDIVNDNITSMIEQAIAGLATINTWTGNAHTLTTANGTTSESRCAMLVAADGAGLSAAGEIICPASAKLYVLNNGSSYAITLKTSAGTGVAVAAGATAFLFCDGTNVNSCVTTIVDGHITGNLTVDGNATINGNTTLGNATSDTITATARFASVLAPSADNTYDLGSTGNSWKDLYIDGTAYLALVDINGGTIDGVSIGASTAATLINVDNLRLDGNTLSSTDTNGNVVIAPNGTGDVQLDADTVRVGDSGAAATLTSNGAGALTVTTGGAADLTLSTNSGTNSGTVVIANGANGNITLTPNGTGDVIVSADRTQFGDSNTDTTLTTNGTGSLNLSTNNGTNSGTIQIAQGVNGNITLTPNGTGLVSIPSAVISGGTANGVAYLNNTKVLTTGSALTFNGTVLTVNSVAVSRGGGAVSSNTAVGLGSLGNNVSGASNSAFGVDAASAVTGSDATAIGNQAVLTGTGTRDTAVGSGALRTASTGTDNTAVGYRALYAMGLAGNYNTALGSLAGNDAGTSINNVFIGYNAGDAVTAGQYNVAIGAPSASGTATMAGGSIGASVVRTVQIGASALAADDGVAIGYQATGAYNGGVGIGSVAVPNQSGVSIGYQAKGADYAVSIGYQAANLSTSPTSNLRSVSVGYQAGYGTRGTDTVAIGYKTLFTSSTNNFGSVAIGVEALTTSNSNGSNVAVGYRAMYSATSGTGNTALGREAMRNTTTGNQNVAVGNLAMGSGITTGNGYNVAVGYQAGYLLTSGAQNTVIGYIAGDSITTGNSNTAIGTGAGSAISTGSVNTFVGGGSGSSVTTGSNNTFVGPYVGSGSTQANAVALADGQGNLRFLYDPNAFGGMNIGTTTSSASGASYMAFPFNGVANKVMRIQVDTYSVTSGQPGFAIFTGGTVYAPRYSSCVVPTGTTGSGSTTAGAFCIWAGVLTGTSGLIVNMTSGYTGVFSGEIIVSWSSTGNNLSVFWKGYVRVVGGATGIYPCYGSANLGSSFGSTAEFRLYSTSGSTISVGRAFVVSYANSLVS